MDGHSTCEAVDICRDCSPPRPAANETLRENCYPVQPNRLYYVADYYTVSGADQMKAEIQRNGPISCGMLLTPNLITNYTGGIYSEYVEDPVS